MDSHYAIDVDPARDLIRITLAGFFDPAAVERFETERVRAYAQLRCPPNRHLTLCDVSAMRIQSQDVVAAFAAVAGDPRYTSRRMAVVTGSSFARLQTRRATRRDTVAYFTEPAEAEAWLFDQSAARAA